VLAENIKGVRSRIEAACRRAERDQATVKLVAVSKTHAPAVIREAIDAGLSVFGENKVQEAEGKIAELGRHGIEWHLIGHLQSNKARRAVELFDMIESLDSVELAERLERICGEVGRGSLPVLIQVDLAGEVTKSGVAEADLPRLIDGIGTRKHLDLRGLMILPPYSDDAEATRPYFRRLRGFRDRYLPGGDLSMGMSHDFEVAIEEGATIVRVGTAIFGER
jgi:pyridoxal phosphate enzyme (YggS family)